MHYLDEPLRKDGMEQEASQVLAECLALVERGEATPEECLRRYPDHANELRLLMAIALEARRVSLPPSSPVALKTWKRRMFSALDERQRRPVLLRLLRRTLPLRRLVYVAASLLVVIVAGAVLYFGPGATVAQAAALSAVTGSVQVLPAGSATWRTASIGQQVGVGDRIHVESLAAATLTFSGGCETTLQANTEIDVLQMEARSDGSSKTIVLYQSLGQTHNCSRHPPGLGSRFEVRTPIARVIAHGTEFTVTVEDDGITKVTVLEGVVNVQAQSRSVIVRAGEGTLVKPESPPAPVYSVPTQTEEPTATPEVEETEEPTGTEELDVDETEETDEVEHTETHGTSTPGGLQETEREEPEEPESPEPDEEEKEDPEEPRPPETPEPDEKEEEDPEESKPSETPEPDEKEEEDPEETKSSETPEPHEAKEDISASD